MKRIERFSWRITALGAAVLLGVGGCSAAPEPPPAPASRLSQLKSDVEQYLQDRLATGASAVLVQARAGGETWSEAHGVKDQETRQPAEPGGAFHIASVTKPMVAAAVLTLVEEERLQLDGLVDDYLPGFQEVMKPPQPVSVRMLLNHTSGMPEFEGPLSRSGPLKQVFAAPITGEQRLALAGTEQWEKPPGSGFEYSSSNYVALGLIIERLTGRSLSEVLRSHVTEPLGMDGTVLAGSAAAPSGMVHGYAVVDGETMDGANAGFHAGSASGGMISTVHDVNTFFSALMQGRLVNPASVEEMRGSDAEPFGLGLFKWQDSCTGDFYYGHLGGTPGYESLAMTSADGTRQLALGVAYTAEPLVPGKTRDSTAFEDMATKALDSTC